MEKLIKMMDTLNNLCDLLNANGGATYSVIDWVFGFIVFENDTRVFDGSFTDVSKWLLNKFE